MARREFRIAAAFDTETCNLKVDGEWKAFTVCYQFNDLRACDLYAYAAPGSDDVCIFRHAAEAVAYIQRLVAWGLDAAVVPIVCGYNLMFDLQPLMFALRACYDMKVNAQSSTNVYTLDLYQGRTHVLRCWDMYHLEMRGLAAMGRTAGLAKLSGEWDYDLVRTPDTPLSESETAYAVRDVQVLPAYLKYLLRANDWLQPADLGVRALTKTSLVRQLAAHEIAPLTYEGARGKRTLLKTFMARCAEDLPACYYDYALRKACFNGGCTFTAARFASVVVRNVASLDVISMHHAHINGALMPEQFRPVKPALLDSMLNATFATPLAAMLESYHKPFEFAYHARVRLKNVRLKKDSPFEAFGIAIMAKAKFMNRAEAGADFSINDAAQFAERAVKLAGWKNRAVNPVFAFGKLYSADWCEIHVSEYEAWCVAQVYDFDDFKAVLGEATCKLTAPPDYVTLQSNVLFERKQDMKHINKNYRAGEPYPEPIPASVPDGIARGLRAGELSNSFVASYYASTVKGAFNSVYGTQAQDVLKPDYQVDDAALIAVDSATVATPDNFFERLPSKSKVLYTYGLRIVGRSRAHLTIGILLLWRAFGERVRVTGGDTDSIKCACNADVTDEMLSAALKPLAEASKRSIDRTMSRVRRDFPGKSSALDGVGAFEIEECGSGRTRYDYHMEAWNKCRVSIDFDGRAHVTAAGLSRPAGAYHIENYIEDMLKTESPETALPSIVGYNVFVPPYLAHSLQRTRPLPAERFTGEVRDHLGKSARVDEPAAVALYACGRWLGETSMPSNMDNVRYLERKYGRSVRTDMRSLNLKAGEPRIENDW